MRSLERESTQSFNLSNEIKATKILQCRMNDGPTRRRRSSRNVSLIRTTLFIDTHRGRRAFKRAQGPMSLCTIHVVFYFAIKECDNAGFSSFDTRQPTVCLPSRYQSKLVKCIIQGTRRRYQEQLIIEMSQLNYVIFRTKSS